MIKCKPFKSLNFLLGVPLFIDESKVLSVLVGVFKNDE